MGASVTDRVTAVAVMTAGPMTGLHDQLGTRGVLLAQWDQRQAVPAGPAARTLPGMDPTVMAAAIGVGGTVIVGVAGFWTTVRTTGKTIASAQESRVWDQRAKVYVDVLAALAYRQTSRAHYMRASPLDDRTSQDEQDYLAAYEEPDWIALNARLYAFASRPVVEAMKASQMADERLSSASDPWKIGTPWKIDTKPSKRSTASETSAAAVEAYKEETLKGMEERVKAAKEAVRHAEEAQKAAYAAGYREKVEEAEKAAETADGALIELIRAELQGKGHPLADW
jgi:hypothetical protein